MDASRKAQLQQQQQQVRSRLKHQKLKFSFVGYIGVLVFLGILQALGVFLFTKGFLLSRSVLPDISNCSGADGIGRCMDPQFDRAVVLVIDALRFDFAVPVDPAEPQWNPNYHNHLPILHELTQKQPNNAVLLKFLADPPTTTLQRLKGLTTGSLPTFIDAGSNFDGDAIDEDNWLLQLHRANKTIAFMGDDTWQALFRHYIDPELNFPYDSLNVWDLHTVDNGVIEHLFPLLETPRWDMCIGHFLGADHVGHRYGPNHHAMQDKLAQMNAVIEKTIEKIDDRTLLVVMGDHGMDRTGNHGGDSPDELESTLFFYSKRRKFARKPESAYSTANMARDHRTVHQIDLVPTLSLLLGLPVPYNNLGYPIDEMFPGSELLRAGKLTVDQIMRYRNSSKEVQSNEEILEKYNRAMQLAETGSTDEVLEAFKDFQHSFLEYCRGLWARFDLLLISLGIAVMIFSLSVFLTYSRSIPSVRVSTMSFEFIGSIIAMSLLGMVLSVSIFWVFHPPGVELKSCLIFGCASGITIGFWAPIMDRFSVQWLYHQIWDFFVFNLNSWSLLALLYVVLHSMIFASNSYVVWEDKLVNYFIATFGFSCLFGSLVARKPRQQKILGLAHSVTFLLLSRLVTTINLCREEQMPYCIPTFRMTRWSVALLYVAALLLPKIIKSFYQLSSSYHAAAPLWIESGMAVLMLMNAVYWTLELFENDATIQHYLNKWAYFNTWVEAGLFKSLKLAIARIVLFVALVLASYSWSRGPLCVKIQIPQANPESVIESQRVEVLENEEKDEVPETPPQSPAAVILGYGNIYGSSYFLFVINVAVAVLLVSKPVGALSICILLVQVLSLLELYDILELRRNLIAPIMMGLLGFQHFFSTGHQATIPSIQWDVGFMTTQTIVMPFTHLNITLNTFGSFFIVCLAIPLITLWRIPPSPKPITVLSQIVTNVTTLITYQTTLSIMSFIFAANFRRHLMVWKIFAPRFMLSALLLIVFNVTLTFVTVWFATGRVLTQVSRIFGK